MSNATDNVQAPRCNICEIEMTPNNRVLPTLDCGGTCLKCMAENGDEGCADAMKKISLMGADTQAGVLRVGCVSSEMITTDNLGLHVEAGSFVPPPFELVFQLDGKPLGVMKFNDDGAMTFEGEAEPAAQIFLDHIVIKHSEQWQAAQKRILELEASNKQLIKAKNLSRITDCSVRLFGGTRVAGGGIVPIGTVLYREEDVIAAIEAAGGLVIDA